jgi:hypothetical protein
VYDPVANQWTDLKDIVVGLPPAARTAHGFTESNGKIYLFGGLTDFGRFDHDGSLKYHDLSICMIVINIILYVIYGRNQSI